MLVPTEVFWEGVLNRAVAGEPEPDLLYYMNEAAGTTLVDSSGNGWNGTFGDTLGAGFYPTWDTQGLVFGGAKCVGVPTAAASTMQTFMVFLTPVYNTATTDAAALLSTNGDAGQYSLGLLGGSYQPRAFTDPYAHQIYGAAKPIVSGSMGLCYRSDGAVFLNGARLTPGQTPSHGYPPFPALGAVSAARLGLYFTGAFAPYQGQMHLAAGWHSLLSDDDIAHAHARYAYTVEARGVILNASTTPTRTLIAFAGDSFTTGNVAGAVNLAFPQKTLLSLANPYDYVNASIGGAGSAEMIEWIASDLTPWVRLLPGRKALCVMIGTNESWVGTLANLRGAYPVWKAAGWDDVIVATGLPRYADDSGRATYNAAQRLDVGVSCDAVADWGGDPTVGNAGDYLHPADYPDGLHPSASNHLRGAGYFRAALATRGLT